MVPPISPDVPGKGVPSDHSGVIATPHTNSTEPPRTVKVRKDIRPIPESLLLVFGQKLSQMDFSYVYSQQNTTDMVDGFQNVMMQMVEETFPLKSILITNDDQVWFNEELRALKRNRLREYCRHGKSKKYIDLQNKFDSKFQTELLKYKIKVELEVIEGKRGSSYSALKKLALRPGEVMQPEFQLPNLVQKNIPPAQAVEIIDDYFSSVSQEYSHVEISALPPNVQDFLKNTQYDEMIPSLSVMDV